MNRRMAILSTTCFGLCSKPLLASEDSFEITRTDEQWRAMLTPAEYRVMRQEGTERAFTSPLNEEKRAGTYLCKGCDLPLYASQVKFESGTGWPSFYESLPNAVETKADRKLFLVRTEVHCRRCGSHLGHVFDDGPPPTGKRHCINGISLLFAAA
ncbi:peptide-methionine (R)-S-oxide reductase MsrB [Tropicimonas isoalkanivorans]|uniref:peptide-methionine (R)-S-oxide reductase n=1 Tax=Tropicimonas isoalkanivorans TaxID=441112 RepID=A0A1I1P1G9_9RHOB|nr:peptide-methionine (R)-S-oxide reductase MsrB [Tropicimonas isoalkanivorans]SFD03575.1 peptide-methionine (R)-S-oxide reductase [Tropicimonas isoalkanivorans]